MTGMLASVTSLAEAKVLLQEGIDILDLKDPNNGALGALDTALIKDIVEVVDGVVTTSATIGDIDCNSEKLDKVVVSRVLSLTGRLNQVGLFFELVRGQSATE